MNIDEIEYDKHRGFISRGDKPANETFHKTVVMLVGGFDRHIKSLINPNGGVDKANFTDFHGLSGDEKLKADLLLKTIMDKICSCEKNYRGMASLNE
ncbi:MAG: hypothetical protein H6Q67_2413 [Firmicutes bacterium]|nr:hypothetical protein [Bacillota bacterium]